MFEIAGSGSTSSDSIVNISHSGASSISASVSTTTTNSDNDKLRTEISKLREEKKVLEGRIRGFKTLSDLLVETRRENDQLKSQVRSLTMSLQTAERQSSVGSAGSPFSLVSLQAAAQQSSGRTSQSPVSPAALKDRHPPSLSGPPSSQALDPKGPPTVPPLVSLPPGVSGPPSSLQETEGPPPDDPKTEAKLISLTASDSKPVGRGSPPPLVHSQESLEWQQPQPPGTTPGLTPHPGPQSLAASEVSTPELLQPDSDKYEESTYEKVGLTMTMGHAGLAGSMYAAGGSGGGASGGGSRVGAERAPTDFPSLSSESSTAGLPQPPSRGAAFNPPSYMGGLEQSLSGLGLTTGARGGEGVVRGGGVPSIPGQDTAAMAQHMHQFAVHITRMEQKDHHQKKLIDTLMSENQDLKKLVKAAERAHQESIVALRKQDRQLKVQLKGPRQEDQGAASSSPPAPGDWVHVEKPQRKESETTGDSDHSLVDRVRTLEQEKAELVRVNNKWRGRWEDLERGQQRTVQDLQSRLAQTEQEAAALRERQTQITHDFEAHMLEMKRRLSEEESLREEAQHQQRLAERQSSDLQTQLSEARNQLADTARHKQALAAELAVLKANPASHETQRSESADATNAASRSALLGEIAMLKEQLKVFAEDFEHERMDRTAAQAARDSAKKSAEQMGRQNHSLSMQVKHLQKQIKDRDDTISWTLRQNESLQRQAVDFKKKLAGEWEEKQRLQRRLVSLEQQQPAPRNPYLSPEPPVRTYHNPLPLHQPPPPPTAYLGGQRAGGGASPRTRTPATGSPELLPGAWSCTACTYINYPGRTVCESCGCVNNPRSYPADQYGFSSHDMYGSEHGLLMSRGVDQTQGGIANGGDLVVDSGQ